MTTARNELDVYTGFPELATGDTTSCPPVFLEYTWYVSLAYAMLGRAWGIDVIPSVGGALLAVLAAASLLSVGANAQRVYAPVALALCTGLSLIAVQFFVHSAQSFDQSIAFVGWLFNLTVVQALSQRSGFLHRFALVAFVIGLGVLPYMQGHADSRLMRVSAGGTGISNPNSLAMWFGFCTVYFIFLGLQSRDLMVRAVYWLAGLSSLFVVALTVSRGPLFGIALACVVGLRSALKRHFFPVVSLVLLVWLVYVSGVFQETVDYYLARGMEESGRGKVWPLAFQRIIDSFWTGVGLEAIPTWTSSEKAITPHNGLLYIGLGAGIFPLMCFLGYLARVGTKTFHILQKVHVGDAALLPPLVTFGLIEVMSLDLVFMSAWVVVVFGLAASWRHSMRSSKDNPRLEP
jgi:O-antigen ligase